MTWIIYTRVVYLKLQWINVPDHFLYPRFVSHSQCSSFFNLYCFSQFEVCGFIFL